MSLGVELDQDQAATLLMCVLSEIRPSNKLKLITHVKKKMSGRVRQVPEGRGEQGKKEKTGCKIICGAPTTLAVEGLMMMMMKKCTL